MQRDGSVPMGVSGGGRLLPLAGWVLAGVTAVLLLLSLDWGIVHDAPLMLYIGREVAHGARSVVDIFDMNMPLVHWLYAVFYALFGVNDLAWRLLDLAVIGGIAALGYRLILPAVGQQLAALAAVCIVAQHVAGEEQVVGQRDVWMVLPLFGAALLIVAAREQPRGRWKLVDAGVLLGMAAMLKPIGLVYAPILLLAALLGGKPVAGWRPAAMIAVRLGCGFAIPCFVVGLVLYLQGLLPAFIEFWAEFVPVYGRARDDTNAIANLLGPAVGGLAIAGVAAMSTGSHVKRWPSLRVAVVLALVIAGFFSFLLQGKGWIYHALPLQYSAILLTAVGLASIRPVGHLGHLVARIMVLVPVPFIVLLFAEVLAIKIALQAISLGNGPQTPPPYVTALMRDLDQIALPDDKVQALDMTDGVIAAVLRSNRRQPTRFIYDFQFFSGQPSAYRAALRQEFLDRLGTAGAHVLVVTNQNWPGKRGFERVDDAKLWPELNERLKTRYRLVLERSDSQLPDRRYRIYKAAP